MMKTLQKIYEYFFSPWDITIIEEGKEPGWTSVDLVGNERKFTRFFVKYKYSHRFRKQEKIVKKYLD